MATERNLETFLDCHPYLLAPELGRRRAIRQLSKGKSRLDLLFNLKSGYCIVELKKTILSQYDVRQIAKYCRLLQKEGLKLCHHYLVGFRPSSVDVLQKEMTRHHFDIRVKFLGENVPLSVLWDRKRRRYVAFEPHLSAVGEHFELRL